MARDLRSHRPLQRRCSASPFAMCNAPVRIRPILVCAVSGGGTELAGHEDVLLALVDGYTMQHWGPRLCFRHIFQSSVRRQITNPVPRVNLCPNIGTLTRPLSNPRIQKDWKRSGESHQGKRFVFTPLSRVLSGCAALPLFSSPPNPPPLQSFCTNLQPSMGVPIHSI